MQPLARGSRKVASGTSFWRKLASKCLGGGGHRRGGKTVTNRGERRAPNAANMIHFWIRTVNAWMCGECIHIIHACMHSHSCVDMLTHSARKRTTRKPTVSPTHPCHELEKRRGCSGNGGTSCLFFHKSSELQSRNKNSRKEGNNDYTQETMIAPRSAIDDGLESKNAGHTMRLEGMRDQLAA